VVGASPARSTSSLRLAELIAAISLATDLGMGQPMEQALRTCLLAIGLGRRLGLSEGQLSEVYYVVLLRFLGCTADAFELARHVGGDDRFYRAGLAPVLGAPAREFMPVALRHVRPLRIPGFLASGVGPFRQGILAHCELAENLAGRLGLSETIRHAMSQTFEYWNGRGLPGKAAGDQIALSARIAFIARDAEVLHRMSGIEGALDTISRRRRAGTYDPRLVDLLLESGAEVLGELAATPSPWDVALAAEPEPWPWIPEGRLDHVLEVFADFVDMKAPHLLGHSRQVAALATNAVGTDRLAVRRAGLVHDLGRVAVPNGTWDKAASLTGGEREQVRLHAYYSERIVSRCQALSSLAGPVGRHHERLDGSGYHRGCRAPDLSRSARVLAVADAYQAMTSDRPWRPALSRDAAASELTKAVSAGELDRQAVDAVLGAAGQPRVDARVKWPAELSDREVEVLRLICHGQSKKEVGQALGISPSTADHHVRHIYEKIGVSTRAGAAVFALQHDLLV
jgi:HD-GYP domain-containing protein (c-di-GMP phosphodiesterase class II)